MYCIQCGKQMAAKAKFCNQCGQSLTAGGNKQSTVASGQQPNNYSNNKRNGILWLTIPWAVLILLIIFTAMISAVWPEKDNKILDFILGLFGVIDIFVIAVGVFMGIYLLGKKEYQNYDKRSGAGPKSEVPAEAKHWSWGAAGLTWIWGVYHGVWLSLLQFVPFVNWVWWIVLGIKGREWAWRARKWESLEQFQAAQRKWGIWGLILFIIGVLLNVAFLFGNIIFTIMSLG